MRREQDKWGRASARREASGRAWDVRRICGAMRWSGRWDSNIDVYRRDGNIGVNVFGIDSGRIVPDDRRERRNYEGGPVQILRRDFAPWFTSARYVVWVGPDATRLRSGGSALLNEERIFDSEHCIDRPRPVRAARGAVLARRLSLPTALRSRDGAGAEHNQSGGDW